MAANSAIEWTHHTFNAWRGCTKVHEGCAQCYAEREAKRFPKNRGIWGPNGTRVKASEAMWREPLKWNRAAELAGERHRVFCASLADVFEDWSGEIRDHEGGILHRCRAGHWIAAQSVFPYGFECYSGCNRAAIPATLDDLRRDLFALIDKTPNLDWLLLTKRPENVRRMWPVNELVELGPEGEPIFVHQHDCPSFCDFACNGKLGENPLSKFWRPNVWLGTSISNQETAERFVPELLKCHDLCPVLFLSCEPLLGPLHIGRWLYSDYDKAAMDNQLFTPLGGFNYAKIRWVIAGGESGHQARPMHPDWARELRDQCEDSTPFFFKQWGEYLPPLQDGAKLPAGQVLNCSDEPERVGKKKAGRLLDGREWNEFPSTEAAHA